MPHISPRIEQDHLFWGPAEPLQYGIFLWKSYLHWKPLIWTCHLCQEDGRIYSRSSVLKNISLSHPIEKLINYSHQIWFWDNIIQFSKITLRAVRSFRFLKQKMIILIVWCYVNRIFSYTCIWIHFSLKLYYCERD